MYNNSLSLSIYMYMYLSLSLYIYIYTYIYVMMCGERRPVPAKPSPTPLLFCSLAVFDDDGNNLQDDGALNLNPLLVIMLKLI